MIHRYIQVTGSSFDRGVAIGQVLKMQIETNLSSQKLFYNDPPEIVAKWLEKAQIYAEYTEKFAPGK